MEPFFQFLGGYWWLVFPLFGVVASVGRAWERGARERHRRRLEIIKAKSEARAARAGGSGAALAGGPGVTGFGTIGQDGGPASADPVSTQLVRLFAAHDDVTRRWLEYELDVAKMIAFPAMSDGRQPLTAAFLRAKKTADGLRPASASAKPDPEQLREYRAAVTEYEVAFDIAERDARRLRDAGFSAAERKRLDTAQRLLTVAVDEAATPAERQLAYRRVREELDGLLVLSDEAIEVLEKRVALELPAPRPDDPSTR